MVNPPAKASVPLILAASFSVESHAHGGVAGVQQNLPVECPLLRADAEAQHSRVNLFGTRRKQHLSGGGCCRVNNIKLEHAIAILDKSIPRIEVVAVAVYLGVRTGCIAQNGG